jgi:hypothetical protein
LGRTGPQIRWSVPKRKRLCGKGGQGKDQKAFGFQARAFSGPEIQNHLTLSSPQGRGPTGQTATRGRPRPLLPPARVKMKNCKGRDPKGKPRSGLRLSPKRGSTDFDFSGGEGWVSPFGHSLEWGRLGRGSPEGETKAGEEAAWPLIPWFFRSSHASASKRKSENKKGREIHFRGSHAPSIGSLDP